MDAGKRPAKQPKSTPKTSLADKAAEQFFAIDDREALKQDAEAAFTEFQSIINDLWKKWNLMAKCQSADELKHLPDSCLVQMVQLFRLSRLAEYRNRPYRQQLAKIIADTKKEQRKLWDLEEQVKVVNYLTENYLQFDPALSDLKLGCGDDVRDRILSELKDNHVLADSDHQLLMNALNEELEARKRLATEIKELENEKVKLETETRKLRRSLEHINPTLKSVLDAMRPLMQLIGVVTGSEIADSSLLSSLPVPLFYIYKCMVAHRDTFEPTMVIHVIDDVIEPNPIWASKVSESPMDVDDDNGHRMVSVAQKPVSAEYLLRTNPFRLDIEIQCKDRGSALLEIRYLPNLNVVTLKCRVSRGTNDSVDSVMSSVILDEISVCDSLFPNDDGRLCPDPVAVLKLRHSGLAEDHDPSASIGRWYAWLQRLAGLNGISSAQSDAGPSQFMQLPDDVLSFPRTVIEAVRNRILARIDLHEQLASFEKLQVMCPKKASKCFPPRLRTSLVGWRSVTLEQMKQHPTGGLFEKLKCDVSNGWLFMAKWKCGDFALKTAIWVSRNYPNVCSIFSLHLSRKVETNSARNKWTESMERHVNVECLKLLPAEVINFSLAFQMRTVQASFDVLAEAGFQMERTNPSLVNYHTYPRPLSHTYVRTVQSKGDAQVLGSWRCLFDNEDLFVHLWQFEKGFAGVDNALTLHCTNEEVMRNEELYAKYCLKRNNSLMLSFAYWRQPKPRPPKHIYELRSYVLKAGSMLEWTSNWSRALEYRRQGDEEVGGFFNQIGQLHVVSHLWAYDSMESRREMREKIWKIPGWDLAVSYTVPLVVRMDSKIMVPTSFSKMQ